MMNKLTVLSCVLAALCYAVPILSQTSQIDGNSYAFQFSGSTNSVSKSGFGLYFNQNNPAPAQYEFLDGFGQVMFSIGASNGKLTTVGNLEVAGNINPGGALQVDPNEYAFQYTGNQNFGLVFNATTTSYEFRNGSASSIFSIGATTGNLNFTGALMPADNAGAAGQILQSQGPGLPPLWVTGGAGSTGPTGPQGIQGPTGAAGPAGPLTPGALGQTLRHDGSAWVADSNLYHDGMNVGVGTALPLQKLHVAGSALLMEDLWVDDIYFTDTSSRIETSGGNIEMRTTGIADNITLKTSNFASNINMITSGSSSNINFETQNGGRFNVTTAGTLSDINLTSGWDINLNTSNGEISLTTTGSNDIIQLNSARNVDIEAARDVNLQATQEVNIGSSSLPWTVFNNTAESVIIGNHFASSSRRLEVRADDKTYAAYFDAGVDSATAYGLYNNLDGNGAARYGVYNDIDGTGSSYYGTRNDLDGNGGIYYGSYNTVDGGDGIRYGVYSDVDGDGTSNYGFYGNVDGDADANYGGFFNVDGVSSFSSAPLSYGVYGEADVWDFDNFGVYGFARGAFDANNYGIYGRASSGDTTYAGYFQGDVHVTGLFTNPSDKKLKHEIKPLEDASELLGELQPKTYLYKNEQYQHMGLPGGKQYGLIAQELEELLPDLVKGERMPGSNPNEEEEYEALHYKSINYTGLIPIIIQAFKEQNELVKSLPTHQEVEDLKSENEALKERMNALENMLKDEIIALRHCTNCPATKRTELSIGSEVNGIAKLEQNIPNPFSGSTVIKYHVPKGSTGVLQVADQTGTLLMRELLNSDNSQLTINGEKLSDGTLFYSLIVDGKIVETRKMVKME